MLNGREIAAALRCSSAEHVSCKGHECPYHSRPSEEEKEEFAKKNGTDISELPEDFFDSCDVDRIALDAAELIEQLEKEK